jgi:ferredoxin
MTEGANHSSEMIRASIDYELCHGHQMCTLGLPSAFQVGDDDEGRAVVVTPDHPTSELQALEDVQDSCPQGAIILERIATPSVRGPE